MSKDILQSKIRIAKNFRKKCVYCKRELMKNELITTLPEWKTLCTTCAKNILDEHFSSPFRQNDIRYLKAYMELQKWGESGDAKRILLLNSLRDDYDGWWEDG